MHAGVAGMAEGDEVFIAVVPLLAPELLVVHLERGHGAAGLAAPAVALENTETELPVGQAVQGQSRRF